MIVEIYGGFRPGHIVFQTEEEARDLIYALNHLGADVESGRVAVFCEELLRQIYKVYPYLKNQDC